MHTFHLFIAEAKMKNSKTTENRKRNINDNNDTNDGSGRKTFPLVRWSERLGNKKNDGNP